MANYGRIVKLLLTVKRENGKLRAGWEKTTHNIPPVRITSCKDVCWWFVSLWPFQYLTRESLRFIEKAISASIVLECAIFLFECHTVGTGGGRVLSFLILTAIYSSVDKYTACLVLIKIPVLPG